MKASLLSTLAAVAETTEGAFDKKKPNILWIVAEDISSHFGYQGERLVKTPNVDRLAEEGVAFSNAYVTAPVCSASRSAVITGMYQTTIGAHNHRSSRGELKHHLPGTVRPIPELFREAGYYTTNLGYCACEPTRYDRWGKEDYNFVYDRGTLYHGPDWSGRAKGQPFFAQVHLRGGKLRNIPQWYEEVMADLNDPVTPEQVTLPPYYPDHPVFRRDWAEYLNSIQYTDKEVGHILDRLEEEEILDNTIVFFWADHGISQARGKQFLYDEGIRIPFTVRGPGWIPAGAVRDDLIAHIDAAATSLDLAGITLPETMQARPLFGPDINAREYVVSARDRCDETVDRIRSVRRGKYKYIRNYCPLRPYLQPCLYKDHKPFMATLRELHETGALNKAQSLQLAETRPEEELYDLSTDPFEIDNLAADPRQHDRLKQPRKILKQWEADSGDLGRFPEDEAMYDSDMAAVLSRKKQQNKAADIAKIKKNIALMKKWKAEEK